MLPVQEITGLKAAREDAKQQADLVTQQVAAERTRLGAALARAEAAEAAVSAANSNIQLTHAEVGSAQVWVLLRPGILLSGPHPVGMSGDGWKSSS